MTPVRVRRNRVELSKKARDELAGIKIIPCQKCHILYVLPDITGATNSLQNSRLYPLRTMKKALLLAVILLFTLSLSAGQEEAFDSFNGDYMDATVEVRSHNNGAFMEEGSGFIYQSEYIITSDHVIASRGYAKDSIQVSLGENDSWRNAEIVGRDTDSDLAVLKAETLPPEARSLDFSQSNPEIGQELLIIGNPYGEGENMTTGTVTGVNGTLIVDEGMVINNVVELETTIYPGNSGGPIITPDGKVAGVISARQGEERGFAVSPYTINEVVPELITGN